MSWMRQVPAMRLQETWLAYLCARLVEPEIEIEHCARVG